MVGAYLPKESFPQSSTSQKSHSLVKVSMWSSTLKNPSISQTLNFKPSIQFFYCRESSKRVLLFSNFQNRVFSYFPKEFLSLNSHFMPFIFSYEPKKILSPSLSFPCGHAHFLMNPKKSSSFLILSMPTMHPLKGPQISKTKLNLQKISMSYFLPCFPKQTPMHKPCKVT